MENDKGSHVDKTKQLYKQLTGRDPTTFQKTLWELLLNDIRLAANKGDTSLTRIGQFGKSIPMCFVDRLRKGGFRVRQLGVTSDYKKRPRIVISWE